MLQVKKIIYGKTTSDIYGLKLNKPFDSLMFEIINPNINNDFMLYDRDYNVDVVEYSSKNSEYRNETYHIYPIGASLEDSIFRVEGSSQNLNKYYCFVRNFIDKRIKFLFHPFLKPIDIKITTFKDDGRLYFDKDGELRYSGTLVEGFDIEQTYLKLLSYNSKSSTLLINYDNKSKTAVLIHYRNI